MSRQPGEPLGRTPTRATPTRATPTRASGGPSAARRATAPRATARRAAGLPTPSAVVQLVRAPAALTVPGDILAGAAAAGWPFRRATPLLGACSVCLYWAGMALNDYADRDVDAEERPHRPIPSGRVSPRFALALAAGLTATGIALAAAAGGNRALGVAIPLAGLVWAYDLGLKRTMAGPAAMAAARSLNVLLGAGSGALRPAAHTAAVLGGHTLLVTALSTRETQGATRRLPRRTLACMSGVAGAAALAGPRRGGQGHRLAATGALGAYLGIFGRAQVAAVRRPDPQRLQGAVVAGLLAMIPLQAACAARSGTLRAAVPLAMGVPLAGHLFLAVTPT
jgi:4-hydroxybenzoate polyprenyltransferase